MGAQAPRRDSYRIVGEITAERDLCLNHNNYDLAQLSAGQRDLSERQPQYESFGKGGLL